jgi:hypothetical protein
MTAVAVTCAYGAAQLAWPCMANKAHGSEAITVAGTRPYFSVPLAFSGPRVGCWMLLFGAHTRWLIITAVRYCRAERRNQRASINVRTSGRLPLARWNSQVLQLQRGPGGGQRACEGVVEGPAAGGQAGAAQSACHVVSSHQQRIRLVVLPVVVTHKLGCGTPAAARSKLPVFCSSMPCSSARHALSQCERPMHACTAASWITGAPRAARCWLCSTTR